MNTCQCENPPGGSVSCKEGQIPFCRVRDGKTHGYCLAPPAGVTGLELTEWFFSELVGKEVTTGEAMTRRDLQAAISDGRFVNEETGEIITFRVPENIYLPIRSSATLSA